MNCLRRFCADYTATILPLTVFTLSACSGGSNQPAGAGNTATATATNSSGSTSGTGNGSGTGSSSTNTPVAMQGATAIVASWKLGWNVGNSLDVPTGGETAWGNPTVTPELFQTVAQNGFDVVRIPVTWIAHTGAAPDYVIDETWMSRVEEVVNDALDQDLYAIINIHHDGGADISGRWLTLVDDQGQVTAAHNAVVEAQLAAMWKQIATHFANYGDHLIFEGMNEIMVDYSAPSEAYLTQINALNQVFVDTVRATGGNNGARALVIPGYNTNVSHTVAGFQKPRDTAVDGLILSAHYYDPWDFAGSAATHTWGANQPGIDSWGQEAWVTEAMGMLKTTYVDRGLPVILGEYGAVNQAGYESSRRYWMEYVTKTAHDDGIVPIYWDNGGIASGKDNFGLFNRKGGNVVAFPVILEAMTRAVTSSYAITDVAAP